MSKPKITLTSSERVRRIRSGRLAFMNALLASKTGRATINTATAKGALLSKYADGGKWRGAIPRPLVKAGLIAKVGWTPSTRPSRHRTPVFEWRVVDRKGLLTLRRRLRSAIEDMEDAS